MVKRCFGRASRLAGWTASVAACLVAATTARAADTTNPVRVIDEQIEAQWKVNKIVPSHLCTDYEFIRRATLDIVGRIAKPDEITRFFHDPTQTRRYRLVQRLVDSDEFAKNWASIWTVWLMTRSARGTYHDEMQAWLEKQFSQKDVGFDKIVQDLLTATGKTDDNGAVNFILTNQGAALPRDKQSEDGYS